MSCSSSSTKRSSCHCRARTSRIDRCSSGSHDRSRKSELEFVAVGGPPTVAGLRPGLGLAVPVGEPAEPLALLVSVGQVVAEDKGPARLEVGVDAAEALEIVCA